MRIVILLIYLFGYLTQLTYAHSVSAAEYQGTSVTDRVVAELCDKRIAILSELPSHGEGIAFELKADVVKSLVRQCGFAAILFEAPVYDFVGLERGWAANTATQLELDNAIGRFWWARQLTGFRRWLFHAARAGRLKVGGLDDQTSATSEYARSALPRLVAASLSGDQRSSCQASVERNLNWSYDAVHAWDVVEKHSLVECLRLIAGGASAGHGQEQTPEDTVLLVNYLNYVRRQAGDEPVASRDTSMLRNVNWYLKRFPPNAKVIIWTATVHGAKRQGHLASEPLGELLDRKSDGLVGTVAFTAFSGTSSMAGLPAKSLLAASPQSLEGQAMRLNLGVVYLDARSLREFGVIESRLFGKVSTADWSKSFDGVVVVRKEKPATFEVLH